MRQTTTAAILFGVLLLCRAGTALANPPVDTTASVTTRPAAGDDKAEIRRAMKEMRIWTTSQVLVPLDQCAFGQDDDGRDFIAAASDFSRAEHDLAEPFRQQFGEEALKQSRLIFPSGRGQDTRDGRSELRGDRFVHHHHRGK